MGGAGRGIVTTVPGAVVQNGGMINPGLVNHVPTTAGTLITRMPFQPGAGALLAGAPLMRNGRSLSSSPAGTSHALAPASILVDGNAQREQAMVGKRFSHGPLRVRMGTTLGGAMAVGGTVGEFHGNAFRGEGAARWPAAQGPRFSRGPSMRGPMLLPHGQQQSAGFPHAGMQGGAMHSGSVGVVNSAPASMGPVNAGHAASSAPSGGHH